MTSCPLAFVVPDVASVVDEEVRTVSTPGGLVRLTVVPITGLPPASRAVNVMVTTAEPSSGIEAPLAFAVSVDPTICIGNCAVTPALAVMVVVRLDLLAVPEEKVNVALPVASVVTVWALSMPGTPEAHGVGGVQVALKLTTMPGVAAFATLSAVTVTVADVELSDFTVAGVADSDSEAIGVPTEKETGLLVTRLLFKGSVATAVTEVVPVPMAVRVACALPLRSVVADDVTVANAGLPTLNVTLTPDFGFPVSSRKFAIAYTVGPPATTVVDVKLSVRLAELVMTEKLVKPFNWVPLTVAVAVTLVAPGAKAVSVTVATPLLPVKAVVTG